MRKTTHKQFLYGDNELLANTSEDAYRRGVHQAFALLQDFVKETGADINEVLPLAISKAREIRWSSAPTPFLLDHLFESVKAELAKRATKKAKVSA